MRIALVADVKEQAIPAEIKDVVHGDGQLDHAEIRGQVATGDGDLIANGLADVGRDLRELGNGELAEVGGRLEGFEERHEVGSGSVRAVRGGRKEGVMPEPILAGVFVG